MVAADDAPSYARKLGILRGQVVQEWGWDEDTNDEIRADVEDACGGELLDEDTDEVIDVVLLWWRDGDGDLVDTLMDAIAPLADDGVIWVLDTQDRPARSRAARRDRRVGAHCGTDADFVGQPRRVEREPVGAAEVAGRAPLMLAVGSAAPGLHAARPKPTAGHTQRLSWRQRRAAGVLPAGVYRHLSR